MVQATAFHEGMRVEAGEVYDATGACPVCLSPRPRRVVFHIQRNPDIDMLECPSCGASSASHMPTQALLDRYYSRYYQSNSSNYTFSNATRFARHLLKFMPGLSACSSLRILDFGGGDGTLAVTTAAELRRRSPSLTSIAIDVVDYAEPRDPEIPGVTLIGHRHLSDVEGPFDLIIASAILEHIPDVNGVIRRLCGMAKEGAYLYSRTPFVLPLAKLVSAIDITYPAHVHDMGSRFWNHFVTTFALPARMVSSRPSLVETTLRESPIRTLAAHALKMPALIELALFGQARSPRWSFVGGWEAVLRFDEAPAKTFDSNAAVSGMGIEAALR